MHDERIHACLDGEIPRSALSPGELQRLEAMEASLADAAAVMRTAAVPDLTARVMEGLPQRQAHRADAGSDLLRRLGGWLWNPVSLAVRPAYAFAGVAVAVTALAILPSTAPQTGPGSLPVAMEERGESDSQMYVQFRIEVPNASQVALAGTFTGWEPELELTEVTPGVWSAMVPLSPGVHDYTFVIDGTRMMVDPYAPSVADSFGGSNSRLFLPVPEQNA